MPAFTTTPRRVRRAHLFCYGHVWVTLAVIVRHAKWSTIGLPLWSWLYVRKVRCGEAFPEGRLDVADQAAGLK
ncbi:MAG: hypothetical protein R3C02_23225 [Planctomycetaceae bacterium]